MISPLYVKDIVSSSPLSVRIFSNRSTICAERPIIHIDLRCKVTNGLILWLESDEFIGAIEEGIRIEFSEVEEVGTKLQKEYANATLTDTGIDYIIVEITLNNSKSNFSSTTSILTCGSDNITDSMILHCK